MGVHLADMVVMDVNEVEARHLGIARLPQLGSMNNPEAFPAAEVEDVGWRLLAKLVKRGRVAGL